MTRNDFLKTLVGLFSGLFFWRKLDAKDTSEWLPPGIYGLEDYNYFGPTATFDKYGKRVIGRTIQINTVTGEIICQKMDEDGFLLEDIGLGELVKETIYAPAPLKCRRFTKEDREFFEEYRKSHPFKGIKILGCTCKEWIHSSCPMWKYHVTVK